MRLIKKERYLLGKASKLIGLNKILRQPKMNYHWNVVGTCRVVWCGCSPRFRIGNRFKTPIPLKGLYASRHRGPKFYKV